MTNASVGQFHKLRFTKTLGPIQIAGRGAKYLIDSPGAPVVFTDKHADNLRADTCSAKSAHNRHAQSASPGHQDPIPGGIPKELIVGRMLRNVEDPLTADPGLSFIL